MDASVEPTELAQQPTFDQRAQDISDGDFSPQGAAFDIQYAIGSYLVAHSSEAPLDNFDATLGTLNDAFGASDADMERLVAAELQSYADKQAQFDPAEITVTRTTAADPVNLATGQFVYAATDFVVAGAGIDFAFVRTYKSSAFYQGALGANWDFSYNLWLVDNGDNSVTVTQGCLSPVRYFLNQLVDAPYFVALRNSDVVVATLDGAFEQRSPGGRCVRFENLSGDGALFQAVLVEDRYGNSISFTYTSVDGTFLLDLVAVNHPSRTVRFAYDEQSRIVTASLFGTAYFDGASTALITRQWTYTYDDFGDLVAVTGPRPTSFRPDARRSTAIRPRRRSHFVSTTC